ncbi:hypothetical protein AWENTII_006823 [Aspergillus wentii]|nr:hypothetical protein MW887_004362 [Aspergillus wentii]
MVKQSHGGNSTSDALLQYYRDRCKDPNNPFVRGDSFLLHTAVENGHEQIVAFMLDKGLSPECEKEWTGRTVIYHAAKRGQESMVRLLLDKGANADPQEVWDGSTVLPVAAEKGHLGIVTMLLDHGVDTDCATAYHHTPLYGAVQTNQEAVVELLLQRGADFHYVCGNPIDEPRNSPLTLAVELGRDHMVQLFLKQENEFGASPFIEAIRDFETIAMIPRLVELGFDPNKEDPEGDSALSEAAKRRQIDFIELLLKYLTPEAKARHAYRGISDIMSTTSACICEEDEPTVKYLLDNCVELEYKNPEDGATLLCNAVWSRKVEVAKALLDRGANADTQDIKGRTPISILAEREHEEMMHLLLTDGFKNGLKIDTPDKYGRTPLFLASLNGKENIVKILLDHGSTSQNARTSANRTAVSVAREQKNPQLLQLLGEKLDENIPLSEIKSPSTTPELYGYVWCDNCNSWIPRWDHLFCCKICDEGDYNICHECLASRAFCLDKSHPLYKQCLIDGQWTDIGVIQQSR